MQFRGVLLWALISSFVLLARADSSFADNFVPGNLKIPVELVKGIKSEKAQPGDPVQMRMAEPILAGKGIVIPADARLFGRVVRSGNTSSGDSMLSIVVERAEWKGHVMPLNAYVVGWGQRRFVSTIDRGCENYSDVAADMFMSGISLKPSTGSIAAVCNSSFPGAGQFPHIVDTDLSHVRIYRDRRDHSTVLVSKKHIHLSGGTLLMLSNEGTPEGVR